MSVVPDHRRTKLTATQVIMRLKSMITGYQNQMKEAKEKHRKIKSDMLTLMERAAMPNMTKQKMQDEMFKIYMEMK